MSLKQNPVQCQPIALAENLIHLLLLCRFDFWQKIWGLPVLEIRRDDDPVFFADSASLASAISESPSKLSNPSQGGTKPSKVAIGRIGIRAPRPLRKTRPTKKEK